MYKIINISHYPILPATFGGAVRIVRLNQYLSHNIQRKYYSLVLRDPLLKKKSDKNISVNFFFSPFYTLVAFPFWLLSIPYGFLCYFSFLFLNIPEKMSKDIENADLIMIEEPHIFYWIYKNYPSKKYLLVEHNVEYDLEKLNFKKYYFLSKLVLNCIYKMELFAVIHATKVIVVSKDDGERLNELYNVKKDKFYVIPNSSTILKKNLNIEDLLNKIPNNQISFEKKHIIAFVGSEHKPNKEALDLIIKEISLRLKSDVLILIIGNVGSVHQNGKYKNIIFTGTVDNIYPYLSIADVAINPMISGSGTNIKILDYLSIGIPTISTPLGVRGLQKIKDVVVISDVNEFHEKIELLLTNKDLYNHLSKKGLSYIKNNFSTKVHAEKLESIITSIISMK